MVDSHARFAVRFSRRTRSMESNMLTEDELALLDAIRETGSLSRAAARLGKAPSTISHAARQLETRFDALLFDRRRYRLQLTPAGHLLAEEAARLMLDVARMTQRVRQIASGWEDRLWIVADEILEFETVLPVIRAFDALDSGVTLRFTHEVLSGTWEALRDGRADLIVGATNEPPAIPGLRWFELGVMEWVFAVAPRHPLASADGPLRREQISAHRAVVVADSSRASAGRAYGLLGGQPALAVPSMRAKVLAQRQGLGVGWLPRQRVASLLKRGELVEKATVDPREPNVLYVAWRGDHEGRALQWWLEQLRQPRLSKRLVQGIDLFA
jgi:DNA-binding transcriptional LysR family regulator